MVQRNVDVDSHVWLRLKIEAIKRNKNLREFAGEILADFIKGTLQDSTPPTQKAIILAAGYESRLRPLIDTKPTAMIKINGKTLLKRLLDNFRSCGVENISVVRGYKKEAIKYSGVKYYYNRNYKKNNSLGSLFCAESEMDTGFIASYSDIWVSMSIIKKLLESTDDITIVVDTDWLKRYKRRYYHPVEEAEKVSVKRNRILKIGKGLNPNETYGEFIGLIKFSKHGARLLKENYKKIKARGHKPFHTSPSLERALLIDMVQEMIDNGHKIHFISVKGGWTEIDTMEDVDAAKKIII